MRQPGRTCGGRESEPPFRLQIRRALQVAARFEWPEFRMFVVQQVLAHQRNGPLIRGLPSHADIELGIRIDSLTLERQRLRVNSRLIAQLRVELEAPAQRQE